MCTYISILENNYHKEKGLHRMFYQYHCQNLTCRTGWDRSQFIAGMYIEWVYINQCRYQKMFLLYCLTSNFIIVTVLGEVNGSKSSHLPMGLRWWSKSFVVTEGTTCCAMGRRSRNWGEWLYKISAISKSMLKVIHLNACNDICQQMAFLIV